MTNDEARMTNGPVIRRPLSVGQRSRSRPRTANRLVFRHSGFVILSSFFRHSDFVIRHFPPMPQFKHIVLVKLKPQTTREHIAEIFEALDDLQEKLPGIVETASGPYESPEGLHKGFTHALVVTFADESSRDACLAHPDYDKFRQLVLKIGRASCRERV